MNTNAEPPLPAPPVSPSSKPQRHTFCCCTTRTLSFPLPSRSARSSRHFFSSLQRRPSRSGLDIGTSGAGPEPDPVPRFKGSLNATACVSPPRQMTILPLQGRRSRDVTGVGHRFFLTKLAGRGTAHNYFQSTASLATHHLSPGTLIQLRDVWPQRAMRVNHCSIWRISTLPTWQGV